MEIGQLKPKDRLLIAHKHAAKVSWKRKQSLEMCRQIDDYLLKFGIDLPEDHRRFKRERETVFQYEAYGDELEKDMTELVKFRYGLLRVNKAVYAVFQKNEQLKPEMLACWYSRHRFDPVWNYRKSQLIRKIYRQYLLDTGIHKQYHPVHLVLTVPHKEGLWKEKEFYAKELMAAFNNLRKTDGWKKYVWGGEYGLEVKKSYNGNGLHIHVHSLVLQNPQFDVNEVRKWITTEWEVLTGATFTHYETLYYFKRDEGGNYITERKQLKDADTGQWSQKEVRKKFYLHTDSSLDEYVTGVLECIKYHFKQDSYMKDEGGYDIALIKSILNNSKGLRFYSRFGKLYKEKRLDFNRLNKEPEAETEEAEEEIMASTEGVLENLINPFTNEPAAFGEYALAVTAPEWIKYTPKHAIDPFSPVIISKKIFQFVPGHSLKEIIRAMIMGKLSDLVIKDKVKRHRRKRE